MKHLKRSEITKPLAPWHGVMVGLWDALFACRLLERDHCDDECAVCEAAGHIKFLLGETIEDLEELVPSALVRYWENTRGRPTNDCSAYGDENPASRPPTWAPGEPCPPPGTAARFDKQFVSAAHRLMKGLWKAQQAQARMEADSDDDADEDKEEFVFQAGHVLHLLTPIIDELESPGLAELGEDWALSETWDDADPEIGHVPQCPDRVAAEAEADTPTCVSALDLIEELQETARPPAASTPDAGGFLWAVISLRGRKVQVRDWFATEAEAAGTIPHYQREEPDATYFTQCWPAIAAARHVDEPWEQFSLETA